MADLHLISKTIDPDANVDVIFVHGLGGHHFETWGGSSQSANFWPRWLADLYPNATIWSLNYEASWNAWTGDNISISNHARVAYATLNANLDYDRSKYFICHSLGGLLLKAILRDCRLHPTSESKTLINHVRAITFLATPHIGSYSANIFWRFFGRLFMSNNVYDLLYAQPALLELNNWFCSFADLGMIELDSIFEMKKLYFFYVVDRLSSELNVPTANNLGLYEDHFSIAKLADQNHPLFLHTSERLSALVYKKRFDYASVSKNITFY